MDQATRTATQIAALLAQRRRDHQLSQEELAALVGIDRQYLSELERGKVTQHLQRLVAVLDALGLELSAVPRTATLATGDTAHGA